MQKIISVGIDIGTSTTQIVFSRLTAENAAPTYMLPHMEIAQKEIIYISPVYFTPMRSSLLDVDAICHMIEKEYQTAHIEKEQVETGAVIITGEAANKENAKAVSEQLAAYAGDFVVAVAGPDLEGILAGAGSGARETSRKEMIRLVNFDIGGGTTNAAVYENGTLLDAYGIHIGGRMVRVHEEGHALYCFNCLQGFWDEAAKMQKGACITKKEIQQLCEQFALLLVHIVKQIPLTPIEKQLMILHEAKPLPVDACSFSGGVGEYVYRDDSEYSMEEGIQYGDIGPFLGQTIRGIFEKEDIPICAVAEKIHATVIGAGAHSMTLSGSTICCDAGLLPLRNIPVIEVNVGAYKCQEDLLYYMEQAIQPYPGTVAFAIRDAGQMDYPRIQQMAHLFCGFYQHRKQPMLILLEQDYAKVLGQTIGMVRGRREGLICIDGIQAAQGDYIDFCKSVGQSLLVVIKTLLFEN